jgi:hypothetical protein
MISAYKLGREADLHDLEQFLTGARDKYPALYNDMQPLRRKVAEMRKDEIRNKLPPLSQDEINLIIGGNTIQAIKCYHGRSAGQSLMDSKDKIEQWKEDNGR